MPAPSRNSSRKKPLNSKITANDVKRPTVKPALLGARRSNAARRATKRSKDIERALLLVWDSLESHLDATYRGSDKKFHRQCVKEYAEVIHILSRLY